MAKLTDRFQMNFWNYVESGKLDKSAVADWQRLGMSGAMSFEFNPKLHSTKQMTEILDECLSKNIDVIVCDSRSNYKTYLEVGEDAFRKGYLQAVKDFGSHKAVKGFHIGDEPNKHQWQAAINSYKIANELSPHLTAFINFFPAWKGDNFKEWLGVETDRYGELLNEFVTAADLKVLCYDCYTQCVYFNAEQEIDNYFKNLNIFSAVAKKNNIPLYTSLLSVAHWAYRPQTEDDFRWQIATAVAHGCTGLFWFFIYERALDETYRYSPIDEFYEKTETFDRLSRQNRIFMKHYADKIMEYKLDEVLHISKAYGGTKLYKDGADDILNKVTDFIGKPLIYSKFTNKDGKKAVMIVNLSQTEPTKPKLEFVDKYKKHDCEFWLAPGMLKFIELE